MRKTFDIVKSVVIITAALTLFVWVSGKMFDVLCNVVIAALNITKK